MPEPTPTELAEMPVEQAAKQTAFSLDCNYCSNANDVVGIDADTYEQAVASGWTDIAYNDGASWNFLGKCPECTKNNI